MSKATIKLWARQLQKGTMVPSDVPADIRDEVVALSKTLPLRPDMIAAENTTPAENEVTE